MRRRQFLAAAAAVVLSGCSSGPTSFVRSLRTTTPPPPDPTTASPPPPTTPPTTTPPPTPGTPAEILARSTVPVLCFHQLRDHRPEDGPTARSIVTPPSVLTAQFQALRDGGYTPVTGDALVDHLEYGAPLPARPVLLTFDDGWETDHSVALPELTRFGFPATFFPQTVVLDHPPFLSTEQLRALDRAGMTIGAHSYDHQRMDRLAGDQWRVQLDEPRAQLAGILGHPVDLLAYPYGVWTQEAVTRAVAAGYRAAFQLASAQDPVQPLMTIRRIMPPPTWDGLALIENLESAF
ncbi:polysaccharide deacetylase family protein [Geodermatophilus sp. SYSU D00758]